MPTTYVLPGVRNGFTNLSRTQVLGTQNASIVLTLATLMPSVTRENTITGMDYVEPTQPGQLSPKIC
jgi:hypothetical protein